MLMMRADRSMTHVAISVMGLKQLGVFIPCQGICVWCGLHRTASENEVLTMFEVEIVRKVHELVKKERTLLKYEKKNNDTKDTLQGKDIVKFTKSLRLSWYGYVERTQNKRMPK